MHCRSARCVRAMHWGVLLQTRCVHSELLVHGCTRGARPVCIHESTVRCALLEHVLWALLEARFPQRCAHNVLRQRTIHFFHCWMSVQKNFSNRSSAMHLARHGIGGRGALRRQQGSTGPIPCRVATERRGSQLLSRIRLQNFRQMNNSNYLPGAVQNLSRVDRYITYEAEWWYICHLQSNFEQRINNGLDGSSWKSNHFIISTLRHICTTGARCD